MNKTISLFFLLIISMILYSFYVSLNILIYKNNNIKFVFNKSIKKDNIHNIDFIKKIDISFYEIDFKDEIKSKLKE